MIRYPATLLAAGLACAAAASIPAEERIFDGPMHFCGNFFAIDLSAGEKAGWRMGPDFTLYRLASQNGGFGLYEGFAPDIFENSRETVKIEGFQKVERLKDRDGNHSYLIHLPGDRPPFYLHLYGQVWKGNESDLPLISRVKAMPADTGCDGPTVRNTGETR